MDKPDSPEDVVVLVVCEFIAAPLCIAAGEAMVNAHYFRGSIGFAIGVPLALAGFTFHWWKTWIAESNRSWIKRKAERWSPIAILLAFAYVCVPSIIRRSFPNPLAASRIASATDATPTSDAAKALACPPIPTNVPAAMITVTIPQPCLSPAPTPHEITLDDGLNFIFGFRNLQGVVKLKVTAPAENLTLRNTLVKLFKFPNLLLPIAASDRSLAQDPKYLGYMNFTDGSPIVSGMMGLGRITRFAGFQIIDDDQDSGGLAAKQEWQAKWNPKPFDADATPAPLAQPTPGAEFPKDQIIVHGSAPAAQGVIKLLQSLGLAVVPGSKIPADASGAGPDLVYIQLGHGSLWKP